MAKSTLQLTAAAVNSGNATVSTSFTFASSNTAAVSISPAGAICGGTWDANFVTCSQAREPRASNRDHNRHRADRHPNRSGLRHEKVDSVMISGFGPRSTRLDPGIGVSGATCASSTNCTCTSLSTVFGVQVSSVVQRVAAAIPGEGVTATTRRFAARKHLLPPRPCDITADLTAGSTSVNPLPMVKQRHHHRHHRHHRNCRPPGR